MKRKLDDNDVPASEPEPKKAANGKKDSQAADPAVEPVSFTQLGLDPRLLQAVSEQGFHDPTLVQRKAIPLAINGQDVLCKSKTGSGKTAAYVLPVLSAILKRKMVGLFPATMGLLLG